MTETNEPKATDSPDRPDSAEKNDTSEAGASKDLKSKVVEVLENLFRPGNPREYLRAGTDIRHRHR